MVTSDLPTLDDLSRQVAELTSAWSSADAASVDIADASAAQTEREAQRQQIEASLEDGVVSLTAEIADLRERLKRSEFQRAADAQASSQANALASGARLKAGMLEANLAKATARAEAAEAQLAAMESRCAAAEHSANSERTRTRTELGPLQQQLDKERAARSDAEAAASSHKEKLQEALKACRQATDECERVRKTNTRLERENESLRQRLGEQKAEANEGGTSINEVFDDLAAMERLVSRSLTAGLDETTSALKADKGGGGGGRFAMAEARRTRTGS